MTPRIRLLVTIALVALALALLVDHTTTPKRRARVIRGNFEQHKSA